MTDFNKMHRGYRANLQCFAQPGLRGDKIVLPASAFETITSKFELPRVQSLISLSNLQSGRISSVL